MSLSVSSLHSYPVKSCGGHPLETAVVEPWGLAGDRRWALVTPEDGFVTAREAPLLLTVDVDRAADGSLVLAAPGRARLRVAVPEGRVRRIGIWRDEVDTVEAATEASAYLSEVAGLDLRLVHLADPTQRPVSPEFGRADDRVSLADGYPLLVTTEASLVALNHHVADGRRAEEWPMTMERFRPNLVVGGGEAWDEDSWRLLRVGTGPDAAVFRAVKGCARCVMTTVDPATGDQGREPLASLVRHRRWDGQSWFGMNLVTDTPGAVIRVGDPVEVLERDTTLDGPPRSPAPTR